MPTVSLTTFLDFMASSGTSRLTRVLQAKEMYAQGYDPRRDYWKALREAIIDMHENARGKDHLEKLLVGIDSRKKVLYEKCVSAYKKWMGKKSFEWLGNESHLWRSGDLAIRVNPELGLRIGAEDYLIKLYFKSESAPKRRVDAMLHLLSSTTSSTFKNAVPAVLDVQRSRLIRPTVLIPNLSALLAGEAAAFVIMWNQL